MSTRRDGVAVAAVAGLRGGYDSEIADNSPTGAYVYIFTRDILLQGVTPMVGPRTSMTHGPTGASPMTRPRQHRVPMMPVSRSRGRPRAGIWGVDRCAPAVVGSKERRAPRLVGAADHDGGSQERGEDRPVDVGQQRRSGGHRPGHRDRFLWRSHRSFVEVGVGVGQVGGDQELAPCVAGGGTYQLRRHHRVKLSIIVSYNKATGPVRVALTLS